MNSRPSASDSSRIPFGAIAPFLIFTFALTWGILALFIFLPDQMTNLFGQLTGNHPLFFLAVYSPAIAALAIVIYYAGITGLKQFLKRLLLWKCSLLWYVFLIIGIPLIFYIGSAIKSGIFTQSFPFDSFHPLLIAILLAVIKGPFEELGWRGFAQPLLQRKMAPVWAGLILGIIWGFWHLPAFLLSGTEQSAWSFAPFFAGTIAISIIMTRLFNSSGGSILLAAFMHFQLMNPLWPDAQPYDTYILAGIAVLVVWFNRKSMFDREKGLTRISG